MRYRSHPGMARYLCVVVVACTAVIALDRTEVLAPWLAPVTELTTSITIFALKHLGFDAVREASVVYQPGLFGYEIHYRCTGFLPVAILAVAMLAHPAHPKRKIVGLMAGIPFLLVINQIRLVNLFVIGSSNPELFPVAHEVLWQAVVALSVLGIWTRWLRWVGAQQKGLPCRHEATASHTDGDIAPVTYVRPRWN